jgi:hypothetical protein
MLPLVDNILRLQEISEYWSREHNRVRTSIEIFDELLTAFWQNKLIVYGLSGRSPIDRLGLLKTTRLRLQHPGFTIVESKEDIPVLATRNFGGSVSIDLTFYIVLPSNESAWTEDILKNAYDALATLSIEDFDDLVKPAFRSLCTTREGLAEYCDSVPYPRPRFWYTDSEKLEPRSFGGRRSVMRQITAEMKRRAALQHLCSEATRGGGGAASLGGGKHRREGATAKVAIDRERHTAGLQSIEASRLGRAQNIKPRTRFKWP